MGSLKSDIAAADAENKVLNSFMSNCMLTGDGEQSAMIIDSLAVAGLIKVITDVKGITAAVWTKSEFISGKKR